MNIGYLLVFGFLTLTPTGEKEIVVNQEYPQIYFKTESECLDTVSTSSVILSYKDVAKQNKDLRMWCEPIVKK